MFVLNMAAIANEGAPGPARAYAYVDEVNSNLVCSVCADPFVDPVSLPCGHTFCRACIAAVLEHDPAAVGASICVRARQFRVSHTPRAARVAPWTGGRATGRTWRLRLWW
jgi:hypothetical protein